MTKSFKNFSQELAELIKGGAVGVLPTDTIYGLVAPAANEAAVERLYKVKGREKKPGTIIAANIDQLVGLGMKARYLKAVQDYWPNPITIKIPVGLDLQYLQLGVGDIAVRIPADEPLRKFLEQTGPLMTTSANHPGHEPAGTIAEAQDYFGDKVDFYADGGDLHGRQGSTIIRIVDDIVEVVREGAVKINEAGEIEK
jgi:L-threonylcarbamoyladenylate synthase